MTENAFALIREIIDLWTWTQLEQGTSQQPSVEMKLSGFAWQVFLGGAGLGTPLGKGSVMVNLHGQPDWI